MNDQPLMAKAVNLISVSIGPLAMVISGIMVTLFGLSLATLAYAAIMILISGGLILVKFLNIEGREDGKQK